MPAELPIFPSIASFNHLYEHAIGPAFLISGTSPALLAANTAFRGSIQKIENLHFCQDISSILAREDATEALNVEATIGPAYTDSSPVRVRLCPVWLGDKKAWLGNLDVQENLQETQNQLHLAREQNEVLLREVLHRVKNNLNLILSLLSLQLNRVEEPYTRRLLNESKSRIFTLSLLQQKIYATAAPFKEIRADDYLHQLARTVLNTFQQDGQQLILLPQLEPCLLPIDVLSPLGLITHELAANAVQHAFPGQATGQLKLELRQTSSGSYSFGFSDNGRGLPAGSKLEQMNSLGAQLVVMLSKQLKGRFFTESTEGKGLRFQLEFDVQQR